MIQTDTVEGRFEMFLGVALSRATSSFNEGVAFVSDHAFLLKLKGSQSMRGSRSSS